MELKEIAILLPCHSLEDFPTYGDDQQAEELLGGWSAAWHPALIAAAGRLPTWYRADGPPDDVGDRLFVLPFTSAPLLPTGWEAKCLAEGGLLVRDFTDRAAAVRTALELAAPALGPQGAAASAEQTDLNSLASDFLALGYSYLTVELLTRQMRYMSNVDEGQFRNETLAAAKAWKEGDTTSTRDHLRNAFEVLVAAKDRFYPVDSYLVDLTLVADTTVGRALERELADGPPRNLLLSASTLRAMAHKAPPSLAALRAALDAKTVSIAGGELDEDELPLWPFEQVAARWDEARGQYQELIGRVPAVYARRRYGLSPSLPQLLSRSGYSGALHFTLDDGRFATSNQTKIRWEGLDSSAIDAIARVPLDADDSESFLKLSRLLGESMDRDHVATIVFAHWPGRVSRFYDDLRRATNYAPVFGRFITLDEYFSQTASPGELVKFKPDRYRVPYLEQAAAAETADPLSRIAAAYEEQARETSDQTLRTLAELVAGRRTSGASAETAAGALARSICRGGNEAHRGYFVANSSALPERVLLDVSQFAATPDVEGHVIAAQESGERKLAVVEVPGFGFAWVGAGTAASTAPAKAARRKQPVGIANENELVNEFLRARIHPETGSLVSLHDFVQRYNRLSAQVAYRALPSGRRAGIDETDESLYSRIVADRVEITTTGPAYGEIATEGKLLNAQDEVLAVVRQSFSLFRGSRTLDWRIEIDPRHTPRGDPWENYYAARFAWRDAELCRSLQHGLHATVLRQFEAPEAIELRSAGHRTSILTGGLPYHRAIGERMLDSLLIVPGETRREFRLAIGVDLPHPIASAWQHLTPNDAVADVPRPNGPAASWLFHLDAQNVISTHWEPAYAADGATNGFRVRLLETEGRPARARLACLRPVEQARHVDRQGQTLVSLRVEGDAVLVDLAAHEWVDIEATWAAS